MDDFLESTPKSGGPGSSTLNVKAESNTGRAMREGKIVIKQDESNLTQTILVKQEGKGEFVCFDCVKKISLSSGGGEFIINGTSNSSVLTFTLGKGKIPLKLPETYIAGGETVPNGEALPIDSGASNEYRFRVVLDIPENASKLVLLREIFVTAGNGQRTVIQLEQFGKR